MAEKINPNYDSMFNLPIPVNQLNPVPTDARYIKDTLSEAEQFAASGSTAYVGELLYCNETEKLYIIKADGTLEEVGRGGSGDVSVDNVTIEKDSDNVISVSNVVIGAYYNVKTVQDRNRIDPRLLKPGTQCYVKQDDKYYK